MPDITPFHPERKTPLTLLQHGVDSNGQWHGGLRSLQLLPLSMDVVDRSRTAIQLRRSHCNNGFKDCEYSRSGSLSNSRPFRHQNAWLGTSRIGGI